MIHINEIKLEGESKFISQFNICSDLYLKSNDTNLTKEEREDAFNEWIMRRQYLELGIPFSTCS